MILGYVAQAIEEQGGGRVLVTKHKNSQQAARGHVVVTEESSYSCPTSDPVMEEKSCPTVDPVQLLVNCVGFVFSCSVGSLDGGIRLRTQLSRFCMMVLWRFGVRIRILAFWRFGVCTSVRDKNCSENGFRFPAPRGFAV